jgi:4-amino-4-deoxy-L-arabinose transferase-like glycosyltransferase
MPEGQETPHLSASWMKARFLPPAILAVFTLATRLLFHGPVYFADGPQHIRCILDGTYIIQPPGYWLFNRIAGLFSDPALAISVMNIAFSVAGVVVFYYAALLFAAPKNAFVAALAYSSVFYVWFSGEIHSTYASQALFPVAAFLALLHFDRNKADWRLGLAAILFAAGAGFRPSDGAFLLPMLLYYSATRLPRAKAALFLAGICLLCLAWIVPTFLAYSKAPGGIHGVLFYLRAIMTNKSMTAGVNSESLANVARYVVPMLVAFWPVLAAVFLNSKRNSRDWRVRMLLLWILPGSLFFTVSYISNPTYLDFLTPAVLLLALGAPRMMAVTALWNAIVFLGFIPIASRRLPVNVWNCFVGHCTRYGVEHQWCPNLSDLQGSLSVIPNQPRQ